MFLTTCISVMSVFLCSWVYNNPEYFCDECISVMGVFW